MGQGSSKRRLIICLGAGVLFGIVCFALRLNLPRSTFWQSVLSRLDSPATNGIDWIARFSTGGNPDQFMLQGVLLWFSYWIIIGCMLGFALYKFTGRFGLR
ncbi:MAG: hypothetical protein U0805_02730 [Pirellulales bacterium]